VTECYLAGRTGGGKKVVRKRVAARWTGLPQSTVDYFQVARHSPKISGSATEFPFQNGAAGSDASKKGSYRAS